MTTKENSIMNRNLKTAATIAALGAAALLSGCATVAFVPGTVHPHYIPEHSVANVPGADKVIVDVIVKNEKQHHNEVTAKKDSLGIPMAGIYMPVAKDFKQDIEEALAERGFKTGPGGNKIVCVMIKGFFVSNHVHMLSVNYTGRLFMAYSVKSSNGKVISVGDVKIDDRKFHHHFYSTGSRDTSELMSVGIQKIVNNTQFLDALMTTGTSGPTQKHH
jgi:uncharacterized lipoprotein YajG